MKKNWAKSQYICNLRNALIISTRTNIKSDELEPYNQHLDNGEHVSSEMVHDLIIICLCDNIINLTIYSSKIHQLCLFSWLHFPFYRWCHSAVYIQAWRPSLPYIWGHGPQFKDSGLMHWNLFGASSGRVCVFLSVCFLSSWMGRIMKHPKERCIGAALWKQILVCCGEERTKLQVSSCSTFQNSPTIWPWAVSSDPKNGTSNTNDRNKITSKGSKFLHIVKSQLWWFGHLVRMPSRHLPGQGMF